MANRAAALMALAQTHGAAIAVQTPDASTSFAELAARAREAAGGLAALGVTAGSHVGILLPSGPQFIVIQQALFALGAVITPINTASRAHDLAHAAAACEIAFIVTCVAHVETASAAGCRLVLTDADSDIDNALSLPLAIAGAAPLATLAEIAATDPAMMLLTSATTGKAKGVVLTAGNLAANYDRTPDWLGLDEGTVILCALPLFNTFGLNQCINAMLVKAARLVILPKFDAAAVIATIAAERCTFFPAVPTMLQKILDHPTASAATLGSLRRIMTGGAPVPVTMLRRLVEVAPHVTLLTGYGLTEATALVTLTAVTLGEDGEIARGRTIGRVLPGIELAIFDDSDLPLPPHGIGEIVLRGPNLMSAYYHAPEDTEAALRNGWLHTGDVGYLDEEGYAYIVDRKKDVIIRGGQNIYPADIEEALYAAPGVAEVAVIGAEHDVLGEVPVAYVAASPGCVLDGTALLEHCRAHLAIYKLPAAIHILPELPKGPTGKILRRALRNVVAA